jgi:hypothetical protein
VEVYTKYPEQQGVGKLVTSRRKYEFRGVYKCAG